MTLSHISVEQFIHTVNILHSNHYTNDIDRQIEALSALTGKPEEHFISMKMSQFKKERLILESINLNDIPGSSPKYIKANGKVYAPVYDFDKLTGGQLMDVMHFIKDPEQIINNLPYVMASFCLPTKRTLIGRKCLAYNEDVKHKDAAEDFKKANILDVYSVAVFFWLVWKGLIETTGGYLIQKILKTKTATTMTDQEKAGLLNILETFGDGITPSSVSRSIIA